MGCLNNAENKDKLIPFPQTFLRAVAGLPIEIPWGRKF